MKIFDGKALFVKFYYIPGFMYEGSPYVISTMPGIKKGISGAIQVGYNFGIIGNIDKKKLQPAIEAIKFMTSRDIQKELALKELIVSGITSLYEEDDVCSNIKSCDFYKNAQMIMKPDNVFRADDFNEKYTSYFYDFLYRDAPASVVLKKMEDLTKVYDFSLNTKDSSMGLIIFNVYLCLLIIILASIVLIFIKKFKNDYQFLTKPFWIILVIGIIMILSTGFTKLGKVKAYKCHLNILLLSLGFTFIYAPILYKLIITFPDDVNKYSVWVNNNKYLFFSILVAIDIFLNGLIIIKPYNVKINFIDEGENYKECDKSHVLTKLIIYILFGYKVLSSLAMLLLCFIEWNIIKIRIDIRLIVTSLYLNIMTLLILFLFNSFKINNYLLYSMIQEALIFIISLSNFIILYVIRIFIPSIYKESEDSVILGKSKVSTNPSLNKSQPIMSTNSNRGEVKSDVRLSSIEKCNRNGSIMSSNVIFKILDYHKKEYTTNESATNSENNNAGGGTTSMRSEQLLSNYSYVS